MFTPLDELSPLFKWSFSCTFYLGNEYISFDMFFFYIYKSYGFNNRKKDDNWFQCKLLKLGSVLISEDSADENFGKREL